MLCWLGTPHFKLVKLLLEEFPMPSLSLLEKISEGRVDPENSVKLLLAKRNTMVVK